MIPDNPSLTQDLQQWLAGCDDSVFTWTECHGLLCAMAVLPQPPDQWQQAISSEAPVPEQRCRQLEQLRARFAARLGAGETLTLPCRLDPYEENEGQDLTAWCTGFLAGVYQDEALWFGDDEQAMAETLLPVVLIAGLDEDEALDALWQDSRLTRQMAFAIPELLQQLLLDFQAPEMGNAPAEED